ncbi:MAG: hypothetical protein HKP58_20160, partial [Desulfatitalea sp.]|nr:hypothetical protein [Desulfatitalea sp.]NNK02732.1 hypothetical protein [Desulfatitalea sp.]
SYAVPAASTTAGSADTSAATVDRIPVDSFGKQMKIAAAIFSALVFLLVWSSFSNYATYFVTTKKDSVEIMKGHFSPTGKHFFAVLHGAQFDQPEKTTYSRKEIFPILFDYYLNRSDAMLIDSSLPDFSAVGDYLQRAEQFALTSEMHQTVRQRRNNFRRLALLYKIDIDMAKASEASLQSALQHLQQAKALTTDPVQLTLIENKIDAATTTLAELKAQSEENETMLPSGE